MRNQVLVLLAFLGGYYVSSTKMDADSKNDNTFPGPCLNYSISISKEGKHTIKCGTRLLKWWKGFKGYTWNPTKTQTFTDATTMKAETSKGVTNYLTSSDYYLYNIFLYIICCVSLVIMVYMLISVVRNRRRKNQARPLESLQVRRQYSYDNEQRYIRDPTSRFALKYKQEDMSLPANMVAIVLSAEQDGSANGSIHSSDGSSGHYVYIQSLRNPYINVTENDSG